MERKKYHRASNKLQPRLGPNRMAVLGREIIERLDLIAAVETWRNLSRDGNAKDQREEEIGW